MSLAPPTAFLLATPTAALTSLPLVLQVQTANRAAEQLLALGSGCSLFRSFLLRHFLSEVGGVAEQLWEAHQVSECRWLPVGGCGVGAVVVMMMAREGGANLD